jgi:hypothetical protein
VHHAVENLPRNSLPENAGSAPLATHCARDALCEAAERTALLDLRGPDFPRVPGPIDVSWAGGMGGSTEGEEDETRMFGPSRNCASWTPTKDQTSVLRRINCKPSISMERSWVCETGH